MLSGTTNRHALNRVLKMCRIGASSALALLLVACGGAEGDERAARTVALQKQEAPSAPATQRVAAIFGTEPAPTPKALFDWAEYKHPDLFHPRQQFSDIVLLHLGVQYTVRSYPNGNHLGITADGHVHGLGPFTNGVLVGLGHVVDYASMVLDDWCKVYQTSTPDSACAGPLTTVSTLAGTSVQASLNGASAVATFNSPYGIASDPSGAVYVAEHASLIRKISPEGLVTTLAGGAGATGAGFIDGSGAEASFRNPHALALDKTGLVFIADAGNGAIRKVTPAGIVSTLATGLGAVQGIAVDSKGNVYVTDYWRHSVKKITPGGVVSTLAGGSAFGLLDGTGGQASFVHPQGISIDVHDNLFIADSGNNAVRKITPAGVTTTVAGGVSSGFANGSGATARFSYPTGVAVDGAGNVFVADHDNHAIRKITPSGVVTTVAGTGEYGYVNGTLAVARFKNPRNVAINRRGHVLVTDSGNHVIREIRP